MVLGMSLPPNLEASNPMPGIGIVEMGIKRPKPIPVKSAAPGMTTAMIATPPCSRSAWPSKGTRWWTDRALAAHLHTASSRLNPVAVIDFTYSPAGEIARMSIPAAGRLVQLANAAEQHALSLDGMGRILVCAPPHIPAAGPPHQNTKVFFIYDSLSNLMGESDGTTSTQLTHSHRGWTQLHVVSG